ncbi:DUF4157 domain-containing protein [Pedobacter sp. L105]|uniref:eCIS core domain-containing protein n=1 Tax=Pedobacter sp. L105 TaxID=1641871 RepID=UPI00131E9DED|nr:DUF4157 domain-containing protein [Pedobacter sp. L105]
MHYKSPDKSNETSSRVPDEQNHGISLPAVSQLQQNNTGLPDQLKSGVENMSGISMDDVKVHYNSDKPAQLQALAYAQGTDIHVGPGQKKHLPHEAWHIVQQKQGRVQATRQMKGGVPVNDDKGLEQEADVMGAMASSSAVAGFRENSNLPGNNHEESFLMQFVKGLKAKQKAKITEGPHEGMIGEILDVLENGYMIEIVDTPIYFEDRIVVPIDEENAGQWIADEDPFFMGFDDEDEKEVLGPKVKMENKPSKKKKTKDEKIEATIESYKKLIKLFEQQEEQITTAEQFAKLFRQSGLNGSLHIDENTLLRTPGGRREIIDTLIAAVHDWAQLNPNNNNEEVDEGKRETLKKALLAGGCEAAKTSIIAEALGKNRSALNEAEHSPQEPVIVNLHLVEAKLHHFYRIFCKNYAENADDSNMEQFQITFQAFSTAWLALHFLKKVADNPESLKTDPSARETYNRVLRLVANLQGEITRQNLIAFEGYGEVMAEIAPGAFKAASLEFLPDIYPDFEENLYVGENPYKKTTKEEDK